MSEKLMDAAHYAKKFYDECAAAKDLHQPNRLVEILDEYGSAIRADELEKLKEETAYQHGYGNGLSEMRQEQEARVQELENAAREVTKQWRNHAVILSRYDNDGDFIAALNALAALLAPPPAEKGTE